MGVGFLRVDATRVANVFESLAGQTSVASIVVEISRTVYQLLLSKAGPGGAIQVRIVQAGVGLQSSGRGKGPAGSTILLVLDGCDNALGPPVDAFGEFVSENKRKIWRKNNDST